MECSYINFDDPKDAETLVKRILEDPEEHRWRSARALARAEDGNVRAEAVRLLEEQLDAGKIGIRTAYRAVLALRVLQQELPPEDVVIVKGIGAVRREKWEKYCSEKKLCCSASGSAVGSAFGSAGASAADFDPVMGPLDQSAEDFRIDEIPVIDMHVHPKFHEGMFLTEYLNSGVEHSVLLATDTDPVSLENPKAMERIRRNFEGSDVAGKMSFEEALQQIGDSLYSPGHVTNEDVADWISDYPKQLSGFGSVDLSRSADYVEKTLQYLASTKVKGIKLLPFSQFFSPADNENMELLMEYCRRQNWMITAHTGCAPGVFEDPVMNRDSAPGLWDETAGKYPDVRIIMAHFGAYGRSHRMHFFDEALQMMEKHENMYADTAAVWGMFADPDVVQKIRDRVGFDRVVFGSDYPVSRVMPGKTGGVIRFFLTNDFLTDQEKIALLHDNAAGLLF